MRLLTTFMVGAGLLLAFSAPAQARIATNGPEVDGVIARIATNGPEVDGVAPAAIPASCTTPTPNPCDG